VAPESRTQESLYKVLKTLKDELKFLLVIARELAPEGDFGGLQKRFQTFNFNT